MQHLFLLLLLGQFSFFTCHHYEYHFIEEKKTWEEAKKYCVENYTDLATVYDMSDMDRLRASTQNQDDGWIGLYSRPGEDNGQWHWSLPGVGFSDMHARCNYPKSENGSKNDHEENCGTVEGDSYNLKEDDCAKNHSFICYNGNSSSKMFFVIRNEMNWRNAQNYCRENHTDLVSGCNQLQREIFKNEMQSVNEVLWIGLFRDTWRWSDGRNFSFRNWDQGFFEDSNETCAVLNRHGKWDNDDCKKTKPFYCYDDKMILIKQEKNWAEALNYCRSQYSDLVSITNPHQQKLVQKKAKQAETDYIWMGLRYLCSLDMWFWISNEPVCYDNWASEKTIPNCGMSGAMEKTETHKWTRKQDTETFNFICALN